MKVVSSQWSVISKRVFCFALNALLFEFSNRAISWFNEGDVQTKRLILEIAFSNLFLRDKKLLIEAAKPFSECPRIPSSSTLSTFVEEVRTLQHTDYFFGLVHKLKLLLAMVEKNEGLKSAV